MPPTSEGLNQRLNGGSLANISGMMASVHLDFIRGCAAVLVLVYHIRYRFFLDYSDVVAPNGLAKLFYASSSFGHDAVMVFFVLSGFLITSSIRRDCSLNRWSWSRYACNRLVRLYVVLLPALGLTLVWDCLGIHLAGTHAVYSGFAQDWVHDFFNVSERLRPSVFFGNVLFLQTIYVPPLGSNEPLWSLAYEFWYYLLFPLIYVGLVHGSGLYRKTVFAVLVAIVALVVNRQILLYFPIWLFGSAVASTIPITFLSRPGLFKMAAVLGFIVFFSGIVLGHVDKVKKFVGYSILATDYISAIGFTLLLYVLLHDTRPLQPSTYTTCSKKLANMSYTLYAVHMPLLVFIRSQWIIDRPWSPTAMTILLSCFLVVFCFAYAILVSHYSEARTNVVRDWILAKSRWSCKLEGELTR